MPTTPAQLDQRAPLANLVSMALPVFLARTDTPAWMELTAHGRIIQRETASGAHKEHPVQPAHLAHLALPDQKEPLATQEAQARTVVLVQPVQLAPLATRARMVPPAQLETKVPMRLQAPREKLVQLALLADPVQLVPLAIVDLLANLVPLAQPDHLAHQAQAATLATRDHLDHLVQREIQAQMPNTAPAHAVPRRHKQLPSTQLGLDHDCDPFLVSVVQYVVFICSLNFASDKFLA